MRCSHEASGRLAAQRGAALASQEVNLAGLQHNHLLNLHAHTLSLKDMLCWPLERGCRQSPFAA